MPLDSGRRIRETEPANPINERDSMLLSSGRYRPGTVIRAVATTPSLSISPPHNRRNPGLPSNLFRAHHVDSGDTHRALEKS
jgi:hypothetical protein